MFKNFVHDSNSSTFSQFLERVGYHMHRLSLGIWVDDHTKECFAHLNVVTVRKVDAWRNRRVVPRCDKNGYDKLEKVETWSVRARHSIQILYTIERRTCHIILININTHTSLMRTGLSLCSAIMTCTSFSKAPLAIVM